MQHDLTNAFNDFDLDQLKDLYIKILDIEDFAKKALGYKSHSSMTILSRLRREVERLIAQAVTQPNYSPKGKKCATTKP